MSHFPVSNSNLSAAALGRFLSEKYFFLEPLECTFIRAGLNDTYLLKGTTQRFIFRVYSFEWRTKVEIEEELRFLKYLKKNEISVSFPILDRNGKEIQTLVAPEGERYGVLFSFAKGKKKLFLSKDLQYSVGKMMARIHRLSVDQKLERTTYTSDQLLVRPLKDIQKYLSHDAPEMKWLLSTQKKMQQTLAQANLNQIRQGSVHLDIWPDNLNITEEGEISLFDFDFCGNGWLCLDVAYYLLQLYNLEPDPISRKEKRDHFIRGYESITPLTMEEKRLLPKLGVCLYFFYLGTQCERFENWSNTFLSESYLKKYIELRIRRYSEEQNF